MKTTKFTQAGIGHVVVLFLVVFVAVVGFAGWKVVGMNKTADKASTVSSTAQVPDKIQSKADLVETSKVLDSAASDVDGGLNDAALNADLNDML